MCVKSSVIKILIALSLPAPTSLLCHRANHAANIANILAHPSLFNIHQ